MSNHSYKCKNGEKVCRLCLKNEKFKISLLCTYAQQEHILPRIEKYLQIKIPTEEKSSKYICYDCFSNLKFIERSVSLAQQNQKYFEHSQQSSENNIFDDESLHTPTEITEPEMSANFINRKKNVTFTYAEEDSQQLFKPTVKTAAVKTGNKRFPFKNDFESHLKKPKPMETYSMENDNILIKQENEEETNPKKNRPHILKLMKSYEDKFGVLKKKK